MKGVSLAGLLKNSVPVVLGVIAAGYLMYLGRTLPVIGDARKGFDA